MSYNKVIILGRLGADPDVKMIPSGSQVATVSIATTRSWVKDGKKEEKTEWHRCVFWNKLAELVGKYVKKGDELLVEGELQTRDYEDQSGTKRYVTEVVANNISFVSGKKQGGDSQGAAQGSKQTSSTNSKDYPPIDDDVPF